MTLSWLSHSFMSRAATPHMLYSRFLLCLQRVNLEKKQKQNNELNPYEFGFQLRKTRLKRFTEVVTRHRNLHLQLSENKVSSNYYNYILLVIK